MSTISSFVSTVNEFPNRFLHYADHIIEWKSFLCETPPYCIWPIIYTAAENRKLWSYTCHYKFRSYYSLISKKFLQTNCHTNQAWLVEHVRVIDRIGIAYFTHFSNVRTFRFYTFWHMASITHFSLKLYTQWLLTASSILLLFIKMFAIGMEQLIVFTWYIMLHYETFSRLYVVTVHMTNLLLHWKSYPSFRRIYKT